MRETSEDLPPEAAVPGLTRLLSVLKQASLQSKRPGQRESMFQVVLIFFVGLIVLLSIDFTMNPPTFNPMVLLFGILVAGMLLIARRWGTVRFCPACGRGVPSYSVFCPICGRRLP